ncbi:MAG TPA: hypothetical protein PLB14_09840 [Smithellaceae bacterium]|jgi:hypothetical protein|nr:hypothetical protein [Syntrophaceae bacterium]HPV49998.1 hypothetical protein [Smithellaceae bacterium]
MKVSEVPQDITYYNGEKRACYALDDQGNYVVVPSSGWEAEAIVNGLAMEDWEARLVEIRKEVLAGRQSPLGFYMELRQMTPKILGKTAGIAVFRVKRHFRPEIFAKLKPQVLERYAQALAISTEELKRGPINTQGKVITHP